MANGKNDVGHVTVYHSFKGFGFIRREKGKDVFFRYDDVEEGQAEPIPGDHIQFEVRDENKGPRAYNIRKIS